MENTTNNAVSSTSDDNPNLVFRKLGLDFTTIKSDPARWNKDWENVIHTFSSSPQEVFDIFGISMRGAYTNPNFRPSLDVQDFKNLVRDHQKEVLKSFDNVDKRGGFRTVWLFLDDKERQRHIQAGLEGACNMGVWKQDARLMCPEITMSKLLKDQGKALLAFMDGYQAGLKGAEPEIYFLPNAWWDKVLEACRAMQGVSTDLAEKLVTLLDLWRNDFIICFINCTRGSILKDIADGNPEMDRVLEKIDSDPLLAHMKSISLELTPSKPLVRCENCTKSPEMIAGSPNFLACSVCKSKLDFLIHYCSSACQKADWRNHKKHCGKAKVSKQLKGTINDPYWQIPAFLNSDSLRETPCIDGKVSTLDVGIMKPDPSRPCSPALQRQIALCTTYKEADYFLFDAADRPIWVSVPGEAARLVFRRHRTKALEQPEVGVPVIGDYLVRKGPSYPALNRELILDQLGKEYGEDMKAKILKLGEAVDRQPSKAALGSSLVERSVSWVL
ncbi:hypothetical protein Hypma_012230 [Hypsizygus marmoreus]|uniref:MYND-type domain-containing protein n=1 Tax=Hypsizygus marmoreus TaxID=39966 RepID=A0A369JFB1_HYPMA|nr:hypothetical protein Hypma_012230 [Hypsizygus marmoreus]